MLKRRKYEEPRKIRHRSIRKRVSGTTERPRLVVFRSLKHIYAQVINDTDHKVLVSASDLVTKTQGKLEGKKGERAKLVGLKIAQLCAEKNIKKVVFDRGGYLYHGRVSLVAQGAREGGLDF